MDYSHNSSKNENKTMRHGQIYTFYPEFNQKNGKLNEPNNNHTNNEVNNINYFNNNSIKHNYNSNILIQRKNKNKYKNINIKNFYFFNGNNTCRRRTDNNGIFEEYIIDYKDGLNLNNFGKNNNLYKYNNCSLQNWRNKNKINNTDSHINTTSSIDGNNEKGLSQIHNNKTYKTYEHFYKVNSRGKKTKLNIGTPYKKIIVNDYSCNNSSKGKISNNISNDTNNNFKYNYKISKTQRNNTSDKSLDKYFGSSSFSFLYLRFLTISYAIIMLSIGDRFKLFIKSDSSFIFSAVLYAFSNVTILSFPSNFTYIFL